MKGLNFSGWSKVGEDKKITTLKHEKGHVMTLAHGKLPKLQQEALKRLKLAEGGDVSSDDQKKSPVTVNVNSNPAMQPSQQSAAPVPVAVPPVQNSTNALLPNGSMNAPAAAQAGQAGAKLGAQIQAAQSSAAIPQQKQYLNQTQQVNQSDIQHINDLKQHADEFSDYTKQNSLKENSYLENMGAGKKMGTALGLILGGAGSGLTGGPNVAYDFLNKQIDRNIQAQKDRFGQQATIWGAYKDLYGDENVASNMAKVHALDTLNHQAALTAAQLGTATAQANLLDIQSKIIPERNKLILDSAGNLSSTPNMPAKGSMPTEGGVPDQGKNNPNPNQKLIDAGIISGIPQAHASQEPQANAAPKIPVYKILKENAGQILNSSVQYGPPKAREDYQKVLDAYTNAQQAEKVINGPEGNGVGGIHDLMQRMYVNSGSGGAIAGLGSHARNTVTGALGAIPEIGPALIGASRIIPRGSAQKEFDSNKSVIETDLANALQNIVAPTDINKIVEANLPAYLDTPHDIERKTQAIVNMVIKSLKHTNLERYKMLK